MCMAYHYAEQVRKYVDQARFIHLRHLLEVSLAEFGLKPKAADELIRSMDQAGALIMRPDGWIHKRGLIKLDEYEVFPWEK